MKTTKLLGKCLLAMLLAVALLLPGCSNSSEGQSSQTEQSGQASDAEENVLEFVAADKTNWDKEVSIDGYAFTMAVNLAQDGSFKLDATCVGKAAAEVQQGGGWGTPGGSAEDESSEEESSAEESSMTDEEKAAKNFSKSGTWTKEEGYGYTLSFEDGQTVKTDFDKASSRQYFYAEIEGAGLTQFQAKDTAFRSEIASDYEEFEIRDAKYIVSASGTTMTGNASTLKVYFENDGTVNSISNEGSSTTYTRGTWSEDEAAHVLTMVMDGAETTSAYCDVAGKEGYRLVYDGNTMYIPLADGVDVNVYTDEDFEGAVLVEAACAEGDYTLQLTEKGYYKVLDASGSSVLAGTYTQDGDTYSFDNGVASVKDGDNVTVTLSFEVSSGSGSNTESVERTFALAGDAPATTVPDENGDAASGEESAPAGDAGSGEEGAPAGDEASGDAEQSGDAASGDEGAGSGEEGSNASGEQSGETASGDGE